jgi:hypothetical protein
MHSRKHISLVVASASVMIIGCGPPYEFVQHAVPSPFTRPGCRAVLEPIHSEQLLVGDKPEAQYVAEKKEKSADSYMQDKADSQAAFGEIIMSDHPDLFGAPGAPDNTFTIRPVWVHWEPGFYAYVVNRPGQADFVVDVIAPNGQTLDRIGIHRKWGGMSAGGRMRGAIQSVGHAFSAYISDNWFCAAH